MQDGVHFAGRHDIARLAAVMGAAFMDDPVSCWLFADPPDRATRHTGFLRAFLRLALDTGTVETTTARDGVALWVPGGSNEQDVLSGPFGDELMLACGPNFPRFYILASVMNAHHPDQPHVYLPFIAVHPRAQGHGIGAGLLRHKLDTLDTRGQAAYLEASTERSLKLYQRLGFEVIRRLDITGGPPLWPMWRNPQA